MPRKTDGIEFELHPGPQKDKDGKPLLYAKLASKKKITFEQLEGYSITFKHMAKGELEACFTKFLNCAAPWFHEGYRVETPIGSFAPKLKLTGEHTDPKTVTGRDIMYSGVDFIPTKDFSREVCSNRLGFRCAEGPVGNSQMSDPKAMEEALRRSLQQGFTSVKIFRICSGLKRDSAQKYLDGLTEGDHPRLRRVKNGKSYLYFPIQEESTFEK
jgi:hypothetical protein